MSKTLIGIMAAVVVIGGGYFVITKNKDSKVNEQQIVVDNVSEQSTQTSQTTNSPAKKMAFAEFIKKGGAYKCTVNQSINNVDTKGVTYISGGMIRGEYATKVQNFNVETTLIVRDGYTYTWTSMAPNMGFKSKVVANTSGNTDTSMTSSYSFNAEKIGDYNCEVWAADQNKFIIPVNITFREVGA